MLTHHAWQTRFGGDAAVLGKVVRLGPVSMTIIGVTPEPFAGVNGLVPVEAFVPATEGALVEPERMDELLTDRIDEQFFLTGRLRPGVSVAEAARAARRARRRAGRGTPGREPPQRASCRVRA